MNDMGFKVAGHPRHKGATPRLQQHRPNLLYSEPDVGILFTSKISNVWVHGRTCRFQYYKYMYIEEKSARELVNYKNFVLDYFNYNEFLNF